MNRILLILIILLVVMLIAAGLGWYFFLYEGMDGNIAIHGRRRGNINIAMPGRRRRRRVRRLHKK
jgi:flagellar basal body-associated protein FliL